MAFGLDARGAARGRKRASTLMNLDEGQKSHFVRRQVRKKKSLPLVHKKTGQKSPPFTVSSLFAGSDTCHIRDSAGAGERAAGSSGHLSDAHRLITNQNPGTELIR